MHFEKNSSLGRIHHDNKTAFVTAFHSAFFAFFVEAAPPPPAQVFRAYEAGTQLHLGTKFEVRVFGLRN